MEDEPEPEGGRRPIVRCQEAQRTYETDQFPNADQEAEHGRVGREFNHPVNLEDMRKANKANK